jgi:hypothetical protein
MTRRTSYFGFSAKALDDTINLSHSLRASIPSNLFAAMFEYLKG